MLTQSREHIIEKTFEAIEGAKNAIVHLYNSTSLAQREQVFKKSKEEIVNIFNRLGFKVQEEKELLKVIVPSRRIDISIKEDLIEEVARIYGIDKIVGTLPVLPTKRGTYNKFLRGVRDILSSLGFPPYPFESII